MAAPTPIGSLSERILHYPVSAPQDSITLINTEVDVLRQMELASHELQAVLNHRRDVLDTIFSYERKPITSAEVVLEMLSAKRPLLKPLARKWLFYPLTERRERKLVAHKEGEGMGYQSVLSRKVPTAERLEREAPLPKGGTYLGIYGGSPSILSVSTVADEIAELRKQLPVADVVFWHLETGQPPALYSLAKGQGDRGGKVVSFPSSTHLEKARSTT